MLPAMRNILMPPEETKRLQRAKRLKNQYYAGPFTASKGIYITKLTADTYNIYRHLGDCFWHKYTLTQNGTGTNPYNIFGMEVISFKSHILCTNAACTYTGVWSDLIGGAYANAVGGVIKYATAATRKVDITFSGGDVYVSYCGRTSAGYVKVLIDGEATLVNELPTHAEGYKYFDTYTAVDLFYKRLVKVASNVPAGEHTLTLEVAAEKNPSSSNVYFYFNGIETVSATAGLPSDVTVRPLDWAASTAYAQYTQINVQGRNYYAKVAGTSGDTAPSHTTGDGVDNEVTWTYMPYSSYLDDYWQYFQYSGSQLEYAYEYQPTGATGKEDVGGLTHGNETIDSIAITVDGVDATALAVGEWDNGSEIKITQVINTTHSETGATDNVTTTLIHTFTSDKMNVYHSHLFNAAAVVGYFYPAMWPLQHWSANLYKWVFDHMALPKQTFMFSGYYGVANPVIGNTKDYGMAAQGGIFQPPGTSSVPSVYPDKYTIMAYLEVTPRSVNYYRNPGAYYAGCGMNASAGTPPSASGVMGKMYFERYKSSAGAAVIGETIECEADYYLGIRAI